MDYSTRREGTAVAHVQCHMVCARNPHIVCDGMNMCYVVIVVFLLASCKTVTGEMCMYIQENGHYPHTVSCKNLAFLVIVLYVHAKKWTFYMYIGVLFCAGAYKTDKATLAAKTVLQELHMTCMQVLQDQARSNKIKQDQAKSV